MIRDVIELSFTTKRGALKSFAQINYFKKLHPECEFLYFGETCTGAQEIRVIAYQKELMQFRAPSRATHYRIGFHGIEFIRWDKKGRLYEWAFRSEAWRFLNWEDNYFTGSLTKIKRRPMRKKKE